MSRLYPAIFDSETRSSAERRLYEAFARELDDTWVVFHSVKWLGTDEVGRPSDGETDFVVAHPKLGILTIEVKGGRIHFDETTGHYISIDRNGVEHDIGEPFLKATENKHTLINKMRNTSGWPRNRIVFGHMVAFPDEVVESQELRPNAPRDLIIDALDMVRLEERLRSAVAFWQGQNRTDSPPGEMAIQTLTQTLGHAGIIRHPLLAEQLRVDEQALVKLTEKQFRYLRFLSGQRRAAIAGCAGSGKTFLAIEKAHRLSVEGFKVLFTCYNRPLADHLGDTLRYRHKFDVFSFHQLCIYWGNQAGLGMEYHESASSEFFNSTLPNALITAVDKLGPQYDAIIVDEGQDFQAEWWEALPWLLHDPADGIFYIFYDDNQRVYRDRSTIPIATAPYILDENCRNTRRVFEVVDQFYYGSQPVTHLGPPGQEVEIIPYRDFNDGLQQLRRLLHRLLHEDGFVAEDIAILTPLGTTSSTVLSQRMGNFQLTDCLPLLPGQLLATTVRRFKGLDRSVIVLCEVDGRLLSQDIDALLYVGTSRAKIHLIILLGQDAPKAVQQVLQLGKTIQVGGSL